MHGLLKGHGPRGTTQAWLVAGIMVALIAAFYALREHWGHLVGAWPYLLLLLCPLMHVMHGHGRKHEPGGSSRERTNASSRR